MTAEGMTEMKVSWHCKPPLRFEIRASAFPAARLWPSEGYDGVRVLKQRGNIEYVRV